MCSKLYCDEEAVCFRSEYKAETWKSCSAPWTQQSKTYPSAVTVSFAVLWLLRNNFLLSNKSPLTEQRKSKTPSKSLPSSKWSVYFFRLYRKNTQELPVRGNISMLEAFKSGRKVLVCFFAFVFLEVSVKIATKAEKNEAALRNTPQSPDVPHNPKLNQELPESTDTTLRSSNSNAGPPRVPDKRAKRTLPLLPKRRPTLLEMVSFTVTVVSAVQEQPNLWAVLLSPQEVREVC